MRRPHDPALTNPQHTPHTPPKQADIALIKRLIRESSDGSDGVKNGGRGGGRG